MEECVGTRVNGISISVRRKRSQTSRRPRHDSQTFDEGHDPSPSSSTIPSDDLSKVSSDENPGCDTNYRKKEFNLNQFVSSVSSGGESKGEKFQRSSGQTVKDNKRCSEGVLAPANWKSTSKVKDCLELESRSVGVHDGRNGGSLSSGNGGVLIDGFGNDYKVKKMKLKVGGVTHTIQANSTSNGASGDGSLTKSSRSIDAAKQRQKQNSQGTSDDYISPSDKRNGLQGIPWRDFSRGSFSLAKEEPSMGKISGRNSSKRQGDKSEQVRKGKRGHKKLILGDFSDDEDDEIRYLEKLKVSKAKEGYKKDDKLPSKRQRKLSTIANMENVGAARSGKDGKKSRSDRASGESEYEEEEEPESDGDLNVKNKKKPRNESDDSLTDGKREMALTTRQRALQSSKEAPGASVIEFPNGLPPAPSRKQNDKLSNVEQQLKKAEAAQRRRMQVEKAARESEAEAIRKILGQDSSRKKREDKIKKRQEELAQERAENAQKLASNTIRCVIGPTGTVVTFSNDVGLPNLFDSKPRSYPPPRERCAGLSCANPYRYRDSKSKLPLCSLQCYKAIQEMLSQTDY